MKKVNRREFRRSVIINGNNINAHQQGNRKNCNVFIEYSAVKIYTTRIIWINIGISKKYLMECEDKKQIKN